MIEGRIIRSRSTCVLGICLLGLVFALVFHQRVLTSCARLLIVDQPLETADYILVIDGDGRFDVVADMLRRQVATGVLLIEDRHTSLVESGVDVRRDQIARRELIKRGVPASSITLIPGESWNDWERAERLKGFLVDHDGQVVVLDDRFATRRLRRVLDCELGEQSQRVMVRGLAYHDHDEHNWWKSRGGCKDLFSAFVEGGHAALFGRPSEVDMVKWTVDSLDQWCNALVGPT